MKRYGCFENLTDRRNIPDLYVYEIEMNAFLCAAETDWGVPRIDYK